VCVRFPIRLSYLHLACPFTVDAGGKGVNEAAHKTNVVMAIFFI
jgi:hypothetical protein